MTTFTINSLLAMQKAFHSRIMQLNEVKNRSTHRYIFEETKRTEEPVYDVKVVDKMITRLNNALFLIDSKIKESNAKVSIEVNFDYDELMKEID